MNRRGGLVRGWVLVWLQSRRRKRSAGAVPDPPPPSVPATPGNLQGADLGGVVGLTWDMSGVEGEDGCCIEARHVANGAQIAEVGRTGPRVSAFEFDGSDYSDWQFRVRAFNAYGYSDYTDWIEVYLS